jgi:hypothetical protein
MKIRNQFLKAIPLALVFACFGWTTSAQELLGRINVSGTRVFFDAGSVDRGYGSCNRGVSAVRWKGRGTDGASRGRESRRPVTTSN